MPDIGLWVALGALLGWGITLGLITKNILPMTNAMSMVEKIDSRMDDRIYRVIARIREKEEKRPAKIPVPQAKQESDSQAHADISRLFGGPPIIQEEQPAPDGMEIVD